MTSFINLNKARKARDRSRREQEAARNRVAFGRTKAEKMQSKSEQDRAERSLAGHQRDRGDEQ